MSEVPDAPQFQEPAAVEPAAPDAATPPAEQAKPGRTPEEYEAEVAKLRREAANYRVKLKEVEPIAKKALEAEEAKKDEVQRANERAQAAEKALEEQNTLNTRLNLAVQYNLPPDDIDYLGSGTPEEMEARAKGIAAKNAAAAKANPPPTDRPMEGLRPGATPDPPKPADDSYPEGWKPKHLGGDGESRITHGQ
jgi:predicted RNase H-like nuclease (RuvC/YqgF family)